MISPLELTVASPPGPSPKCTRLVGHSGAVLTLQATQQLLISGSEDNTARIWDLKTCKSVRLLTSAAFDAGINSVCIHPFNAHAVFTTSGSKIYEFDLRRTEIILKEYAREIAVNNEEINQIAISPDGKFMASCDDDATIQIVSLESGAVEKTLVKGHTNIVSTLQFSPNKRVISGGMDCQIIEWDWNKLQIKYHPFSMNDIVVSSSSPGINPPHVHNLSISPDGEHVVGSVGSGFIVFCDLPQKKRLGALESHLAAVTQVKFSKFAPNTLISGGDDKRIVTYASLLNEKKKVQRGNVRGKGKQHQQPEQPLAKITNIFTHTEKINWLETNERESFNLFVADVGKDITVYSMQN